MFPIQRAPSRKVCGEFYGQPWGAERPTAPPRRMRGLLAGGSWRQPSSGLATGVDLHRKVYRFSRRNVYHLNSFWRPRRARVPLQEAISAFGLPARWYHDNGAELTSHVVLGALEQLGIRHVASTVGVPAGRGAIERLLRTFEESFLPEMAAKAMVPTLDELNRYLLAWARESYERNPHEGLGGRTPLQAWEQDRAPLRRAEPVHLTGAFLLPAVRGVDKTALISVRACPGGGAGAGALPSGAARSARADLDAGSLPADGLPLRSPGRGPPANPRRPAAAGSRPKRPGHLPPPAPRAAGADPAAGAARRAGGPTLHRGRGPAGAAPRPAPGRTQERRWLGETWRRCGGLQAERCTRALAVFIARHGTGQHLLYYVDQIEAAHLRAAREGES